MQPARRHRYILGALALSFFALHATFHAVHGRWHDILWACTLSNAIIGLGLIAGSAELTAVGVSWLCMGNITWLIDVFTGGEFFATSTFTHFGGLTVGILGARILGWRRRAWLWATLGMLALQQLSRLFTPPAANVNLAFSIYTGWESYYPSYRVFWLLMCGEAVVVYYLSGLLLSRLLRRKPAHS